VTDRTSGIRSVTTRMPEGRTVLRMGSVTKVGPEASRLSAPATAVTAAATASTTAVATTPTAAAALTGAGRGRAEVAELLAGLGVEGVLEGDDIVAAAARGARTLTGGAVA